MLGRWFFLIFLFLAAELALLLAAAGRLGGASLILWCLATGFMGVGLVRLQGLRLLQKLTQQAEIRTAEPAIAGALLAFSGILLIVPGLLSDAVGLFMILPSVRRHIARRIAAAFRPLTPPAAEGVVIEGEYWRKPPSS